MAESYRGLTIRIGGDTTKLTQALKAANQSASATESQLRRLNTALKLDPTSLDAAQLQLGGMQQSAAATAMKLATLNDALRQVGSQKIGNSTVAELAEQTRNANIQAEIARSNYNKVTDSLASMYQELTKLAQKGAEAESAGFLEKLKENTDLGKVNVKDLQDAIGQLAPAIRPSVEETESFIGKVEELKRKYEEAAAAEQAATAARESATSKRDQNRLEKEATAAHNLMVTLNQEYDKLANKFSNLTGEVFNFDSGNVSIEQMRTALQTLPDSVRPAQVEINKFLTEAQRLKIAFTEAKTELERANIIAEFKDLQVEIAGAQAKVVNLTRAMSEMSVPSELMRSMAQLNENINVLKDGFSSYMSMGKSMSDAAKLNPDDQAATAQAMQMFSEAERVASEEAERLGQRLEALEGKRDFMEQYADYTKSATQQLFEAAVAHTELSAKVSTLEGNIAEAERRMGELSLTAKEAARILSETEIQTEGDRERAEEYNRNSEAVAKWRVELEAVGQQEREASDAFEAAKIRSELEQVTTDTVHWRSEATRAQVEMAKLSDEDIAPKFDVSAAEQYRNAIEAIAKGGDFGGLGKEIDAIDAAFKEATNRAQSLKRAMEADPSNIEAATLYEKALADATARAASEQSKLKQAMDRLESEGIDQAAVRAGTFARKLEEAKARAEAASAAMGGYEGTIKALEGELGKLEEKSKQGILSETERQNVENLRQSIDALRASMSSLGDEANRASAQLGLEQRTQDWVDAQTRIQTVKAETIKLGEEAKKTGETDATPKVDEAAFMQSVNMIAQAAKRAAGEIVQSANEIDVAYRDMRKTVNGTEEQFESLRESAIQYSKTHFTSADTMLEMEALGGQLGILAEDLERFGTISSNLDIATDMDADDVALKLGQMANILGLDIDGIQGMADALVRLGNNMAAQESSIMNVAQRFAAVASTANFSGEEVLAWSAAIASTGQRSEAAATAISNTVSGIEQAIAVGGDELEQFAAIAQMSADEFVTAWRDDPTEALRAFLQGLNDIKESDESAVAALENMGITGVRQQQTLLALSQTMDNLGDALEMSGNAWDGVSDKWGDSGDAANEAQKKAEGFSGSLAIMKNNAQNMAASLGEGFIPMMNAAATVMGAVTDVLDGMPAPLKSAIVSAGAAGIAFSTLGQVVSVFGKGWSGALEALNSTSSITEFIAKVTKVGTAAEGAAEGASLFGTAMGGPVAIGVAAAVIALGAAISAIGEYEEHQAAVRDATSGLVTAMDSAQTAYANYQSGAESTTDKIRALKDAMDEATESQAALAQQMSEAWAEIGTDEATLDHTVDRMEELAEKSNLTASEQKELIALVEMFNDMTGQNISVIDEQTGLLDASSEVIRSYADAWKESTESAQALEDYGRLVQEQVRLEDELAAAIELQGDAVSDQSGWFVDLRNASSDAAGAYSGFGSKVNELSAELESNRMAQENALAAMSGIDSQLAAVEAELARAGDSLGNYGNLTDAELRQVAAAYSNTADKSMTALERIYAALEGFKKSANTAASEAANAVSGVSAGLKTTDPIYKSYKSGYDADYKALKASLDSQYKAQQRAYNNAYKAAQKAYNSVYKARQKAYDNEYKAAQKAYENQYNALKKRLDNEYNARKKAYDAQLKALKKNQEAEVDAFNDATDAKLKAMEREYKERLRLLELEYGGATDDIDDQIEALEEQTEAEKKAIEEREQQEKVAELQSAVDKAKSRRKRAEAEKALNDYLQELEQKRHEDSRKAEIERLKEQKDAIKDELADRKEALKAQYDAEVEAYKQARADQLEALKESLDAEYEQRKEQLDARLELLKESHQTQLDNLKEAQQAQLESLKEAQQSQLEALKESQQEQLEAMKDNQSIQLENLKASHQAQLDALKAANDERLQILQQGGEAALLEHEGINSEIEKEEDRHADELGKKGRKGRTLYKEAIGPMPADAKETGEKTRADLVNALNPLPQDAATIGLSTDQSLDEQLRNAAANAGTRGSEASTKYGSALGSNQSFVEQNAQAIANASLAPFSDVSTHTWTYGWDALVLFANGATKAWNEGGVKGVERQIEDTA